MPPPKTFSTEADADAYVPNGSAVQVAQAYQAGLQQGLEQSKTTNERLERENDRLAARNEDLRDELEAKDRDHRAKLDDLRDQHECERRELDGKLAEAKEARQAAEIKLQIQELRADFDKRDTSSTFDRLAEPLIESLGALAPALMGRGTAPLPVASGPEAVTVAYVDEPPHPAPPAPATSAPVAPAPESARDGAGAGAPPAQPSTDEMIAEALRQRFEQAVVDGALATIRGGAAPGDAVARVVAQTAGAFGLTPSSDQLARLALAVVANAATEGHPADRVAAALAPVVEGLGATTQLLRSVTADQAVPLLWGLARLPEDQLTPERRAYAADVLGALSARVLDAATEPAAPATAEADAVSEAE